ncbi:Ribose-phosphate pyrophosphokinase [Poriferisphaera corsica]|uniref:Ribose-phosphate pyrophosphokinase n=2 Tax=Poriferisphaera corsica TaxID=2528020 RepID=A0A517YTS3_9BACT|nr:ribose-phosphate pyrophosphokinase [Poriferisphaera corsica]QDU33631.1 Ribose-phosphate pyrophosphokinase [Poriferisphaera corsica]
MSRGNMDQMKVFCGRASRALGERICQHLDIPMGQGHTDLFPDGEVFVKIEEDVRGRDCFVLQSTHHPVNTHLMELLIYIDCLKRASAKRITAVIPYFGYARQDRKDEGRVPITAKLVANMLTRAGADRVMAMDLHAEQIQGFFDIPVDHLHAAPVIVDYFKSLREEMGELVLVSPDVGNVKMANSYANWLGGDLAIIDKRRVSGSEVVSNNIIGDVEGKVALMVDDMISTAGTMCEAARLLKERGAKDIIAACTHPVLVGLAMERLAEAPISKIIVSDTIPCGPRTAPIQDKIVELSTAELLGEAMLRVHNNESVSSLFRKGSGGKR